MKNALYFILLIGFANVAAQGQEKMPQAALSLVSIHGTTAAGDGQGEENSRFEIEVTINEAETEIANDLIETLKEGGYRASLWKDLGDIEKVWGVSADYLEGKLTILYPPGRPDVGRRIAKLIRQKTQIQEVKIGMDKASKSAYNFGLLVPPGYKVNP